MTSKGSLESMEETDVKQIEIIVDNYSDEYKGVTMMPIQNISGDIKYVIVVQEGTTQVNSDIQDEFIKVYDFDENENLNINNNDTKVYGTTKKTQSKRFRGNFQCSVCSYTTHRRYLLLRHLKSHSENRDHKCNVCARGFKSASSLQNHTNMHYGLKPYRCKYCNTPFTTSGELVRHIRYKHTHEKPHKCQECEYASVELSKLRRHQRCHTGERPYQCPHCTYASADTFKLKRHLRTHTGEKPYKCEYCNMQFTQCNSLKTHKQIHNISDRREFACDICPSKCGRMTDLRLHIQKLHTAAEQPFKCKICAEIFADRYTWKIHRKTHKGEKCFKCEMCSFAACTLARLKSHALQHTAAKPFGCAHCDQRFRQKQLLRRHENLYHKPGYVPPPSKEKTHSCQRCGRAFAYLGNLTRHLTLHEPKSTASEQIGISERIKNVQCDSEEPKVKAELPEEPANTDNLNNNKKITLYDTETKSYFVIEVINSSDSETITEVPTQFIEENIEVEEEMMLSEDVKDDLNIDNVELCFRFDE